VKGCGDGMRESGDVSRGRDEFGDVWQHTNDTR
jgi:hypothetical protein